MYLYGHFSIERTKLTRSLRKAFRVITIFMQEKEGMPEAIKTSVCSWGESANV